MSGSGETGGRERRQHLRVRIAVDGSLEVPPHAPLPCQIYNMSIGGALIASRQGVRLGQPVVIHVDEFGPISGHIGRVTSTVIAIVFEGCDEKALAGFLMRHRQVPQAAGEATELPVD